MPTPPPVEPSVDGRSREPSPRQLEFDRDHVWHPYAPLPSPLAPLPVVGAEGTRLQLADGRELIDGMASWWSAIHGYRHPRITAAVHEQVDRLPHVMFGGLTHAPAIRLAERLVEMSPAPLECVFFADSGSVAVEVALKLAIQHWNGRGLDRRRFLTVRGGYHGDTFGAMSICDPEQGMHRLYGGFLPEQVFVNRPPDGFEAPLDPDWTKQVEAACVKHREELAAVVVEPIVQGAGGMRIHSPACLRALREICDRHELLLVCDEIATGFGRTGEMFACHHAGIEPDVMCVGKALTGGTLTLAATIASREVAETVAASEPGALMHGPTFMANPVACAAASASLSLLEERNWRRDIDSIERTFTDELQSARELPGVSDVRMLGAIAVIELDHPVDLQAATAAAVRNGVWLRPFGRLIYAMPPYVCNEDEVAAIARAMLAATAAG